MIVGPIFVRELSIAPRRARFFVYRAVYAGALALLVATAWLILTGTQVIRCVSDTARFGVILFQILAPLQLALIVFFTAMTTASSVSLEKDRRTLALLLMTRLTNSELVLGKMFSSLLHGIVLVIAGLPVFVLVTLFGGVSLGQVFRVFAVTLASALLAGSLGTLLGFWREKTFQTLALTTLVICFWLGFWEAVAAGVLGDSWFGVSCQTIAAGLSPLRAILAAARPAVGADSISGVAGTGVNLFFGCALAIAAALSATTVLLVRVWNPTREIRRRQTDHDAARTASRDVSASAVEAETARHDHVDAQLRARGRGKSSRRVWDNPILWREVCTRAYGRKILIIRVAYLLLVAMVAIGVHWSTLGDGANGAGDGLGAVIPAAAKPLAPCFLVSLVIVNALAVTSITSERDGQSLDLLLATDLTPKEFVFGKLGGVFSVAGPMVVAPMALTGYAWLRGAVTAENFWYLIIGTSVMNLFVATLGIHCGMRYANTRNAIGVSLGTVFFLFLGVITCILMMISFSGSFQVQLAPFLAFILGGSVGLYVALGVRNPSKAILAAALLLPFFTFYAITSFLMRYNLAVFLVTVGPYGFTTAAMLVPALYEFDFAMGRTSTTEI